MLKLTVVLFSLCSVLSLSSITWKTEKSVIIYTVHEKIENIAVVDKLTYYNAESSQTDSSPLITAALWTIDTVKLNTCELRWIAVSQKMIRDKIVHYGDTITVTANDPEIDGLWIVADCMAKRWDDYKSGYCADLLLNKTTGKASKGLWTNVKFSKRSIKINCNELQVGLQDI